MLCCSILIQNFLDAGQHRPRGHRRRRYTYLECKTASINSARLWKGLPEYVQLQVMHQLAVTRKQAADVAVLLGGQHLEIHRIERDESMIARLIDLEWLF